MNCTSNNIVIFTILLMCSCSASASWRSETVTYSTWSDIQKKGIGRLANAAVRTATEELTGEFRVTADLYETKGGPINVHVTVFPAIPDEEINKTRIVVEQFLTDNALVVEKTAAYFDLIRFEDWRVLFHDNRANNVVSDTETDVTTLSLDVRIIGRLRVPSIDPDTIRILPRKNHDEQMHSPDQIIRQDSIVNQ